MVEEDDEILALRSIYEDKLSIKDHENGKSISITIYPATAEDSASQYVCLDLSVVLGENYPFETPKIQFSKSRGLSDASLDELNRKMLEVLKEREGESVLFDLFEMAKDMLTSNNIPSCLCSICLSGFQEGDEFLKTECFHYFHCFCLNGYNTHLDSSEENEKSVQKTSASAITVPCPICRLPVSMKLKTIQEAKPPLDSHVGDVDEALIKNHREKFDKIYQRQLENGSLIDLEYEQNKHLLSNIQQTYETRKVSMAKEAKACKSQNGETRISGETSEEKTSGEKTSSCRNMPRHFHRPHAHSLDDKKRYHYRSNYKNHTQRKFWPRNEQRENLKQSLSSERKNSGNSDSPRGPNTRRQNGQGVQDGKTNGHDATTHEKSFYSLQCSTSEENSLLQARQNAEKSGTKVFSTKEFKSSAGSMTSTEKVEYKPSISRSTNCREYSFHKNPNKAYHYRGQRGRSSRGSRTSGRGQYWRERDTGARESEKSGKSVIESEPAVAHKTVDFSNAGRGNFTRHSKRREKSRNIYVSKETPFPRDSLVNENQS